MEPTEGALWMAHSLSLHVNVTRPSSTFLLHPSKYFQWIYSIKETENALSGRGSSQRILNSRATKESWHHALCIKAWTRGMLPHSRSIRTKHSTGRPTWNSCSTMSLHRTMIHIPGLFDRNETTLRWLEACFISSPPSLRTGPRKCSKRTDSAQNQPSFSRWSHRPLKSHFPYTILRTLESGSHLSLRSQSQRTSSTRKRNLLRPLAIIP